MSMYIKNINKTEENKIFIMELVNENNDLTVRAKWDGCCDIKKYSDEVTKDNIDYIHICELQEFINNLQEVVNLAKENFSEDDYERYWV